MPSTYAHYCFGKEVLDCLPPMLCSAIREHRELYDIGLHGPDILFYYHALSSNAVNQQGSQLHKEPASAFFSNAKSVLDTVENKSAARAYLYGFICHFALDSVVHPYVEKMIQESGVSHNEIETEFDRSLLLERQCNPDTHLNTRHIHPSMKNGAVIAPFFDDITAKQVEDSLKEMVTWHKMTLARNDRKRNMIYRIMKIIGKYDGLHGIVMPKEPKPVCEKYAVLFHRLFKEAVPIAVALILQYQDVLFKDKQLPDRFSYTFGAGEHWQQLHL